MERYRDRIARVYRPDGSGEPARILETFSNEWAIFLDVLKSKDPELYRLVCEEVQKHERQGSKSFFQLILRDCFEDILRTFHPLDTTIDQLRDLWPTLEYRLSHGMTVGEVMRTLDTSPDGPKALMFVLRNRNPPLFETIAKVWKRVDPATFPLLPKLPSCGESNRTELLKLRKDVDDLRREVERIKSALER